LGSRCILLNNVSEALILYFIYSEVENFNLKKFLLPGNWEVFIR
jgi:hypothetical protein